MKDAHEKIEITEFTSKGFVIMVISTIILLFVVVFTVAYLVCGIKNLLLVFAIYFGALSVVLNFFFTNPGAYETHLLLNKFNGKFRAVFGGWKRKYLWEVVVDIIDLKGGIISDIPQTFSTSDGEVSGTVSILTKVNAGKTTDSPEDRSLNIATFASNDEEAVKEMIESGVLDELREFFNGITTNKAVKSDSDEIMPIVMKGLEHLQEELKAEVIELKIKNLDFSEETKKSKNSQFRGGVVETTIHRLMEKFKISFAEAQEVALVTVDGIRQNKNINDINISGVSPELVKEAAAIAKGVTSVIDKSKKTK